MEKSWRNKTRVDIVLYAFGLDGLLNGVGMRRVYIVV
uniref:Uncharacterized protein n=1 Tax=Arabidopsis thaliana TaxID=3702 RepID=Q56XP8_ARATH|nr:hypothetical protein [Arabidopsis thaliana]